MITGDTPDSQSSWSSAIPKAVSHALLIFCTCGLASSTAAESALRTWNRIKDKGSCEDFRQFVSDYGDTPLASMARRKVKDCEREDEQRARREAEEKAARERSKAEQRAARNTRQAPQNLGCGHGFWTAKQLATYFGNHTWEGRTGITKWQEFYAADGTMRGRAWKQGERRPDYRGRWYLDGDHYCYCTADCRSHACRKVRQMGCQTWTWDIDRNKKRSRVTKVYRGNPLGL